MNYISARQYCIEVIPQGNHGEAITILKNDQVVDSISAQPWFTKPHTTCFDSFDLENDIFEIRIDGNGDAWHHDGTSVFINIINQGVTIPLRFGSNENADWILLDGDLNTYPRSGDAVTDGWYCRTSSEGALAVRIQNNKIIGSFCKRGE